MYIRMYIWSGNTSALIIELKYLRDKVKSGFEFGSLADDLQHSYSPPLILNTRCLVLIVLIVRSPRIGMLACWTLKRWIDFQVP